jgi:two-component system invasion response regulator UvrY
MVRVITVDDHAPFLDVAHELMNATPGFESAGEVGSAEAGLAAIEAQDPDLVLLDIHMPGMSGIEMARRVSGASEAPVVVLISAQDLTQLPADAQRCGAAEVISKQELKPATLERLWHAHGRA